MNKWGTLTALGIIFLFALLGVGVYIHFELHDMLVSIAEEQGVVSAHEKISIDSQIKSSIFLITTGFLTAVLTFLAFRVQSTANKKAREDIAVERVENRYFELVGIYKEIMSEITLDHVGTGKQVFHFMFFEYKHLFYFISAQKFKNVISGDTLSVEECAKIAFCFFYNGITGPVNTTVENSECMQLIAKNDYLSIVAHIHLIQQADTEKLKELLNTDPVKYINDYVDRSIKTGEGLMWFDGHRLRLPAYMKYLDLISEYVLVKSKKINAKEYLKYLTFRMTEHEFGVIYAYVNSEMNTYTERVDKIIKDDIVDIRSLFYKYNTLHEDFLA